jgi:hypothetical protein
MVQSQSLAEFGFRKALFPADRFLSDIYDGRHVVVLQVSHKRPERQAFVTNRIKIHGSLQPEVLDYLVG